MSRVAQLAVAAAVYAIDRPYSYRVPEDMPLAAGMRVLVPFGHGNRRTEGVVLSVQEGDAAGLKAVERMLDDASILTGGQLRLAAFMKERYFCTFYDAVKAILPAGLWFDEKRTLMLVSGAQDKLPPGMANSGAARLVQLLTDLGGSAPERTLRQQFESPQAFDAAVQALRKRRLLRADASLTQKASEKTIKVAALAVSAEEAEQFAAKKQFSAPLQAALLRLLCTVGAGPCRELCELTGASMQTVSRLAKLGLIETYEQEQLRSPKREDVPPAGLLTLNAEQQIAFDGLNRQMTQEKPGAALLYGVTGSGKTSVYLALIRSALDAGRSAMLLVPEIALTPQLLHKMTAHFGKTVAVLHSSLRVGERYDEWRRIARGEARVVVGTRSAVFAPLQNPGLLILDEEQEHTYKSDQNPKYHARDVARFRCAQEKALLLLASATPSLESFRKAEEGKYTLIALRHRFGNAHLPAVRIVDMRGEAQRGQTAPLGQELVTELKRVREEGNQAVLFLNRRGASKLVTCAECGATYSCPNCSVSLTYHQGNQMLVCHHCGYRQRVDDRCPVCGGELRFLGDGTERIEADVHALFPGVETLRMDADAIAMAGTHEALLQRFVRERIPIMIGTQMITKGLNFENVTLVGVLNADQSLYVGDYRANERTFSLITQVVGRSGRGDAPGRAVIQTFTPANETIRQAARQDYDAFYRSEIALRQLNGTPPFSEVLAVTVSGAQENAVVRCCAYIRDYFRQTVGERAEVLGPAPLPVVRMNNRYRYRVTLYCSQSKAVRRAAANIVMYCNTEKSFRDVTVFADDNPLD